MRRINFEKRSNSWKSIFLYFPYLCLCFFERAIFLSHKTKECKYLEEFKNIYLRDKKKEFHIRFIDTVRLLMKISLESKKSAFYDIENISSLNQRFVSFPFIFAPTTLFLLVILLFNNYMLSLLLNLFSFFLFSFLQLPTKLKNVYDFGFPECLSIRPRCSFSKYFSSTLKLTYAIRVYYCMLCIENSAYRASGLCPRTHKIIHY